MNLSPGSHHDSRRAGGYAVAISSMLDKILIYDAVLDPRQGPLRRCLEQRISRQAYTGFVTAEIAWLLGTHSPML